MSSSLFEEAINLQRAAHELMYLGMDGSPIYSDDLSRRNGEVYRLTAALYGSSARGTTTEEQANVCLALPASLLKLRLLTACYGEVFDEPLADEARKIISSWDSASLTAEQQEAVEEFRNVVDNPYPWEYLED